MDKTQHSSGQFDRVIAVDQNSKNNTYYDTMGLILASFLIARY